MERPNRQLGLFVRLLLGCALCFSASVQAAENATGGPKATTHIGYPRDWSFQHIVMTGNNDSATLKAGLTEPRHVYNMVMRRAAIQAATKGRRPRKHPMSVDWSVSLENGFVPANQFPALYSVGANTQNCNGDYMLLGLNVTSGIQANVVGITNLYTAMPCNGGSPFVAFAYNTVTQSGGQIMTSPTLSIDGTMAAFVESATAGSFFHVLVLPNPLPTPPTQTAGTVLAPATPTSCAAPTAAGCMTTVQISAGANTLSSPWIDYSTDTAYIGTDDGKLYKISPVFGGGAPVVAADANWPVTVATLGSGNITTVLSGPVVDNNAGRIFIGDGNGFLYAVNLTNPAKTTAAAAGIGWVASPQAGTGVVDPPIAVTDNANPAVDQVFAFTGCSSVVGVGGAITQLPANFASSATVSTANTVDLGSSDGAGNCTGNNVHSGYFDNEFWTNGTTAGHIFGCGFLSGGGAPSSAKMYMFPFTAGQITNSNPPTASWTVNNVKGLECSPLTEFFDGTTDRLFFGVGGTTRGYIKNSTITSAAPFLSTPSNCVNGAPTSSCVTAPSKLGGTSGIIVDNQLSNGGTNIYFSTLAKGSVNGQRCKATGGTANPYCAVKLTQSALQ
jgi:hypothetical protein